jgi:hypothetical protein
MQETNAVSVILEPVDRFDRSQANPSLPVSCAEFLLIQCGFLWVRADRPLPGDRDFEYQSVCRRDAHHDRTAALVPGVRKYSKCQQELVSPLLLQFGFLVVFCFVSPEFVIQSEIDVEIP